MFLFKKLAAPLLFPLPVCLGIIIVGLILLWFTRRQKGGKILVSFGTLLLVILSNGGVADLILRPLERQYLPLSISESVSSNDVGQPDSPVKWVVVLGEGHTADPSIPSTSQLTLVALGRLVEGVRVHRILPGSKLILSGGQGIGEVVHATLLADAAKKLGVDPQDIVLETDSRDTEDEARIIHQMIGSDKFVLVTSASHMPRSMALFTKAGMNPIPAPANYMVKKSRRFGPEYFYPSANALYRIEVAIHEYLGLVWSRARGTI
jgi:uncharacterized SAM-binding protein YcdF (DUF218 family)